MASDSRLPVAIFAALLAIIALPFVIDSVRENRRPVLVEARIVTSTTSDPVFREGLRRVPSGDLVEVVLAVRLESASGPDRWLAPAARLEIDGVVVDHEQTSTWPDDDRLLRVFWFSVESTRLGGELTADTAARELAYRTFLAPEMGRGLRADRLPEFHNDDHMGRPPGSAWTSPPRVPPDEAGTTRLYARVELVDEMNSLRPLQKTTTSGVARIFADDFPTVLRAADFGENIEPAAAELLGLPGFEPSGETFEEWNAVTIPAFGRSFSDLVNARMVVSSWTLASTAATGTTDLAISDLDTLGTIRLANERLVKAWQPISWGEGVRSGDLLAVENHWLVLLGDNGDGVLDTRDPVLHSWGHPPEETTILGATGWDVVSFDHYRPKK